MCVCKFYGGFWLKPLFGGVFSLLLRSNQGSAQPGIGGGFEYGTAIFVNNGVFAVRPALGISGMLSYSLRDSRLFPSVTYLLKTIHVPVNSSYYGTLDDVALENHFVLNINYKTASESNYRQVFFGIGIARINPESNLSDNHGNAVTLVNTGAQNVYPIVQAGAKYMHRILDNSSFYLGLEANLKYIRMRGDSVYDLQQGSNNVKAVIAADILFPGVLAQLDYFFERRDK